MGKIIVTLNLTNHGDLVLRDRKLSTRKPRQVKAESLVDRGVTRLYLKRSVIRSIGLRRSGTVMSRPTNGVRKRNVYEPVRLDLMGRHGVFEVVDVDDNVPNLLGQVPLEYLDFVDDPKRQKLVPNPDHGNKQMSEEY